MMTPSIFGENLFDDDWMDRFEKAFWGNTNPLYGKHAKNMMKTDVREHENGYCLLYTSVLQWISGRIRQYIIIHGWFREAGWM